MLILSSNDALIVSVFQPVMTQRNPSKNEQLTRLETALREAATANSSLLVLPELFLTGYSLDSGLRAERRGGSSYEAAQNLALKYNVSVIFTYPELGDDGAVYDSAALLHRTGHSLVDYRKVNLASGEDVVFTAGESFSPVIEIEPGVRAGVLICQPCSGPHCQRLPERLQSSGAGDCPVSCSGKQCLCGLHQLGSIERPFRSFYKLPRTNECFRSTG